jgi:TonB dependent receptor/TonB-dependent Receptor Plug Domain
MPLAGFCAAMQRALMNDLSFDPCVSRINKPHVMQMMSFWLMRRGIGMPRHLFKARKISTWRRQTLAGIGFFALMASLGIASQVVAHDVGAGDVIVTGRRLNIMGGAVSASEGFVGRSDIDARPFLRSGDLLEFVPGLVATQHSGSGKANQYFLRGFNLDHGSDFSTYVDGMPVNMRTHGHGQGYTDLNFVIQESVEQINYRKGVYYADVGDFSGAGSARFFIADRLDHPIAEATVGAYGFLRAVALGSMDIGDGRDDATLLYGFEGQAFDGPWTDINENVEKLNGVLRYAQALGEGRVHMMLMGYDNRYTSHDQIPERAVKNGLISAFGNLDETVGGSSSRYSVSGGLIGPLFNGIVDLSAYAIDYRLNLFSNFTYFLDDPVHGDQFQQRDDRSIYGTSLKQQWQWGKGRLQMGAEARYDDIHDVGLFRTKARSLLSVVRRDKVKEESLGLFVNYDYRLDETLRFNVGARHDFYGFDVKAISLAANTGERKDDLSSLKGSLIYRPDQVWELYASAGQGFHSNDARGVTIAVDPVSGESVAPVDPLVRSYGAELGVRLFLVEHLQATATVWTLRSKSEILFIGDAGATEASGATRRRGFEGGLYWFPNDIITAEVEIAQTRARLKGDAPEGRRIPGAIPLTIGVGATARLPEGWLAAMRLRHFGAYPLIEDNSERSDGSTNVNLRFGYETEHGGFFLDIFNALDSKDHDIDYFYASRLPGEPEGGIEDRHFNIAQPRSVRLTVRRSF